MRFSRRQESTLKNVSLREMAAFAENEESYRKIISEADTLAARARTTRPALPGDSVNMNLELRRLPRWLLHLSTSGCRTLGAR